MPDLRGRTDAQNGPEAFGNIAFKLHAENAHRLIKQNTRHLGKCVVLEETDTLIHQVTLLTSVSSEEVTDCRTAYSPTTLSMRAFFPRILARISNVQRKCVEQPREPGQQTIVVTDYSELFEHDTALHSTFMKDNLYSFGDSLT